MTMRLLAGGIAGLAILLAPAPGVPEPRLSLRALARGPCPVRVTHHRDEVALALCGIHHPADFDGAFRKIDVWLAPDFKQGIRIDAAPDDRWGDVEKRLQLVSGSMLAHRLGLGAPQDPNPLWLDFGEYLPAASCETTMVDVYARGAVRLRVAGWPGVRNTHRAVETNVTALRAALAARAWNRCEAIVLADPDRPWREIRPVFEALHNAGYNRFAAPERAPPPSGL